jgi:GTP-binding protein
MDVLVMEGPDGKSYKGRINQVLTFEAWSACRPPSRPGRDRADQRHRDIGIGVTVTDPTAPRRCRC